MQHFFFFMSPKRSRVISCSAFAGLGCELIIRLWEALCISACNVFFKFQMNCSAGLLTEM